MLRGSHGGKRGVCGVGSGVLLCSGVGLAAFALGACALVLLGAPA